MKKKKTTNAVSELNALCDVLSCMRTSTALSSAKHMYKHFCKPETGTTSIWYGRNYNGKIIHVHFMYTTWLGAVSKLSISTIKPY